jgi:hypothetical protein
MVPVYLCSACMPTDLWSPVALVSLSFKGYEESRLLPLMSSPYSRPEVEGLLESKGREPRVRAYVGRSRGGD